MRIYLVRHGQSGRQVDSSLGWDSALTDAGHQQARRLGDWLGTRPRVDSGPGIEIAAVCTSPLQRAHATAGYTCAALDLPALVLETLAEAPFHVSDHLPCSEGPLQPPLAGSPSSPRHDAFKARTRAAWEALVGHVQACGGPVLAVTHGGLIKTALRAILGGDAVSFRLYNTALCLIEWRARRWRLVYLNLFDHLPPSLRTA
jgi:broad specificity phosphatase PhoE